jgi:tetratricopeptide (TPR) repeat protein
MLLLLAALSCLPCHEEFVRSYAQTGKAQSVTRPRAEVQLRQEGAHGSSRWVVAWIDGKMLHAVNDTVRPMEWAVGSGDEGKEYLFRLGDALFQSPLAWFARRRAWDLAADFPRERKLGVLRPATPECLLCHTGKAEPVVGTQNRYAKEPIPEPAITCERCHGDAAAHVKNPLRANIVNPRRLAPAARDSVCEQCHLAGVARVANPGRQVHEFRPGQTLEEVFSVYVPVVAADPRRSKVKSHSEQLALSRCSIASAGKLWCGTCHDSHARAENAFTHHQEKCLSCHGGMKPHGEACVSCHMPRSESAEGGHVALTDHRIRKPGVPKVLLERSAALRAWREPAPTLRARGLGLAYAATGQLQSSYDWLIQAAPDAAVQEALGVLYLRAEQPALAVPALAAAVRAEPKNSRLRLNLAAAYLANGDVGNARAQALEALALEPLLEDGYGLLERIEPRRAEFWREEFLKKLR